MWDLSCGLPCYSSSMQSPLREMIHSFGTRCYQYADDIQFYISLSRSPGDVVENLNCCLPAMIKWLRVKLNLDKTEVILVGIEYCASHHR